MSEFLIAALVVVVVGGGLAIPLGLFVARIAVSGWPWSRRDALQVAHQPAAKVASRQPSAATGIVVPNLSSIGPQVFAGIYSMSIMLAAAEAEVPPSIRNNHPKIDPQVAA